MNRSTCRALVATGLGVVLLSGCGSGSQVRAGAAALVGSERITSEALSQAVSRGLADPAAAEQVAADRDGYQRQVLSRLVNHDLLAVAARERGVSVTPGQVDSRLAGFQAQAGGAAQLEQQAAQGGIAVSDLRSVVSDVVLQENLGDALTADLPVSDADLSAAYNANVGQYDRVHTAHILVADEALARRLLTQVTDDPASFPALARQYSTDAGSKEAGGDLGFVGRGQLVPEYEDAAFPAKDGATVLAKTEFGWHVIKVIAHQRTTLQQATPELRRTVLEAQRQKRTQEVLAATAARLGVKVNPRFGRWDAQTSAVAETAQGPDSVSAPGGTATTAPLPDPLAPAPAE